jgi:hypothetical protein
MSTTDMPILDIYQMSIDTGISEDDIRWNLERNHLALVTDNFDIKLVNARQARNAYHNLLWLFKNRRTGCSGAEISEVQTATLERWKELSMDELAKATTRGQATRAFNEAPPEVRKSKIAITRLTGFYKLSPTFDT